MTSQAVEQAIDSRNHRIQFKETDLENPAKPTGSDTRALRRAFDRLAADYAQHTEVQSEIGRRMLSRMEWLRLAPSVVLDAGAGNGAMAVDLARRFPQAHVLALDIAWRLLRTMPRPAAWQRWLGRAGAGRATPVCGNFLRLPLADASVDLVTTNLALNWAPDLPAALAEMRRVLRPDGLIMLTLLGPDTLRELRSAGSRAAADRRLPDMHDVGDMLIHSGFTAPVMDQEHITLSYRTAAALRRDLRYWGGVEQAKDRRHGLRAPGALRMPIPEVTLEVVHGHAWTPAASMASKRRAGEAVIRFEKLARK